MFIILIGIHCNTSLHLLQIIVLSRDTDDSVMEGVQDAQLLSRAHDNLTILEVNIAPCTTEKRNAIQDNMLLNMGLDVASTNLVCVSPSDVIFHPAAAGLLESHLLKKRISELPYTLVVPVYYTTSRKDDVEEISVINISDVSAVNSSSSSSTYNNSSGVKRRDVNGTDKYNRDDSTPTISAASDVTTPTHLPYPSLDPQARQQAKQLLKPFHSSQSSGDALTDVAFNAQVPHTL